MTEKIEIFTIPEVKKFLEEITNAQRDFRKIKLLSAYRKAPKIKTRIICVDESHEWPSDRPYFNEDNK